MTTCRIDRMVAGGMASFFVPFMLKMIWCMPLDLTKSCSSWSMSSLLTRVLCKRVSKVSWLAGEMMAELHQRFELQAQNELEVLRFGVAAPIDPGDHDAKVVRTLIGRHNRRLCLRADGRCQLGQLCLVTVRERVLRGTVDSDG